MLNKIFRVCGTFKKKSKSFGLFLSKIWINFKYRRPKISKLPKNRRKILRKFEKNNEIPTEKPGERQRKFLENYTLNFGESL